MDGPQFVHESRPQRRAALFQQLRTDRQVLRHRQEAPPPGPHHGEDRHQCDAHFGEAVERLLLVARIVRLADKTLVDEAAQPVRQDVGGDAFLRFRQEFAEMAAIAEHHVAQHDQAPAVAEDFERQVDRAAGAVGVFHRILQNCLHITIGFAIHQLVAVRNWFKGARQTAGKRGQDDGKGNHLEPRDARRLLRGREEMGSRLPQPGLGSGAGEAQHRFRYVGESSGLRPRDI
nr:hypothetical protein SHINE37_44552 [Rhizobiaceae bacterium]